MTQSTVQSNRAHDQLIAGSDRLSRRSYLGSGSSRSLGGLLSGISGGSISGSLALNTVDVVILLSGGVDRDLNSDLTALDLLAVHLVACLLLELLGTQSDETKTAALARLTTSLELLDHEAGNRAKRDLSLGGGVVLEDLKELHTVSNRFHIFLDFTYLVLLQVVRQVGNHDLSLGGNAVLRRTTLLALARLTGSGILVSLVGTLLSCKRFVRGLGEGSDLAGYICRSRLRGSGINELDLFSTISTLGLLVA